MHAWKFEIGCLSVCVRKIGIGKTEIVTSQQHSPSARTFDAKRHSADVRMVQSPLSSSDDDEDDDDNDGGHAHDKDEKVGLCENSIVDT